MDSAELTKEGHDDWIRPGQLILMTDVVSPVIGLAKDDSKGHTERQS